MEDTNFTIAKITHEIRNPLTLINSSLQLIESMHPEVKEFQFWTQTMEDVIFVNQLLEDLAAYSDKRRFFMCEVDLKDVIHSLEESLKPYTKINQKHFTIHMPAQLPSVFGNPLKLKQAFLNLLKNAFESTGKDGCVSMSIRKYLDQIIIRITDDGCGMSPEAIDSLFKPFSSSKSYGTGLGLAITHKIIEAHYGAIEVSSTLGRGTTFTITLPHI
ncbi:MAG: two-component sensor histidine kinase [Lachnospiraceae bacterium]|nr:two-component sensor histidine kinase [Lachnospiraceae bacterium]